MKVARSVLFAEYLIRVYRGWTQGETDMPRYGRTAPKES
jgi:hypothetical protein